MRGVAFEDFVGDAGKAATDTVSVEDNRHAHLFAASLGRVKENDRSITQNGEPTAES
jgi:hypothetical protein